MELVDIPVRKVTFKKTSHTPDVGLRLTGTFNQRGPVFIGQILDNSPAAAIGDLHVGDRIMAINGQSTENIKLENAQELLGKVLGLLTLTVGGEPSKHKHSKNYVHSDSTDNGKSLLKSPPQLNNEGLTASLVQYEQRNCFLERSDMSCSPESELGFSLGSCHPDIVGKIPLATHGTFIFHLKQGSPGAKAGLQEFDRLISINGNDVSESDLHKVRHLLAKQGVTLSISVEQQPEMATFALAHPAPSFSPIDSHSKHPDPAKNTSAPAEAQGNALVANNSGEYLSPFRNHNTADDVGLPAINCLVREGLYPGTQHVERTKPSSVSWTEPLKSYSPPFYTAPNVLKHPRADPSYTTLQLVAKKQILGQRCPRFNQPDGLVDRRSYEGLYDVSPEGVPLYPYGRTGMCGRGMFALWGPNHAVHMLISRWKRSSSSHIMTEDQHPLIEVLALRNNVTQTSYLPSVFIRPGEDLTTAMQRALELAFRGKVGTETVRASKLANIPSADNMLELPTSDIRGIPAAQTTNDCDPFPETNAHVGEDDSTAAQHLAHERKRAVELEELITSSLGSAAILEIYRGLLHDPRNTDNAWIETAAFNYHDESGSLQGIHLSEPDENSNTPLHWLTVTEKCNICSEQFELLKYLAAAHSAYFAEKHRWKKRNTQIIRVALQRTSSVRLGLRFGTTNKGQHIVTHIEENSIASNNLKVKDIITEVNNLPITGWSHEDVKQYIIGHAEIVLTLKRRIRRSRASSLSSRRRRLSLHRSYSSGTTELHHHQPEKVNDSKEVVGESAIDTGDESMFNHVDLADHVTIARPRQVYANARDLHNSPCIFTVYLERKSFREDFGFSLMNVGDKLSIKHTTPGTIASRLLDPLDEILTIGTEDTKSISASEAERIILGMLNVKLVVRRSYRSDDMSLLSRCKSSYGRELFKLDPRYKSTGSVGVNQGIQPPPISVKEVEIRRSDTSHCLGFDVIESVHHELYILAVESGSPALNLLFCGDRIVAVNDFHGKDLNPLVLDKLAAQDEILRFVVLRMSSQRLLTYGHLRMFVQEYKGKPFVMASIPRVHPTYVPIKSLLFRVGFDQFDEEQLESVGTSSKEQKVRPSSRFVADDIYRNAWSLEHDVSSFDVTVYKQSDGYGLHFSDLYDPDTRLSRLVIDAISSDALKSKVKLGQRLLKIMDYGSNLWIDVEHATLQELVGLCTNFGGEIILRLTNHSFGKANMQVHETATIGNRRHRSHRRQLNRQSSIVVPNRHEHYYHPQQRQHQPIQHSSKPGFWRNLHSLFHHNSSQDYHLSHRGGMIDTIEEHQSNSSQGNPEMHNNHYSPILERVSDTESETGTILEHSCESADQLHITHHARTRKLHTTPNNELNPVPEDEVPITNISHTNNTHDWNDVENSSRKSGCVLGLELDLKRPSPPSTT